MAEMAAVVKQLQENNARQDTLDKAILQQAVETKEIFLTSLGKLGESLRDTLKDTTDDLNTVLSSSSVWSGNQGINGVSDFLNNEPLQDLTKTDLFNKGLSSLQNAGIVTGLEDTASLGGLVSGASKYGAEAVKKWTEGAEDLGQTLAGSFSTKITSADMNKLVRGGQYAVSLTTDKISDAVQGFSTATTGVVNTTVRTSIDSAIEQGIASQKVRGIDT